jgi:hypothetical protein
MARLVITAGAGEGTTHELTRAMVLGRQKGVDILVEDAGTSREHAKVYRQGDTWFVIDLNSRNGTLVNGAKVARHPLVHGDVIGVGNTRVRFDAPENAPPARAAAPVAERSAPAAKSASFAAGPSARGPSVMEKERERIRTEAQAKARTASGSAPATGGDGGIVIKETVLQYGRVANRSGIQHEDLAQRGPVFKLIAVVVCALVFAGIVWGIVAALEKDPEAAESAEDE